MEMSISSCCHSRHQYTTARVLDLQLLGRRLMHMGCQSQTLAAATMGRLITLHRA